MRTWYLQCISILFFVQFFYAFFIKCKNLIKGPNRNETWAQFFPKFNSEKEKFNSISRIDDTRKNKIPFSNGLEKWKPAHQVKPNDEEMGLNAMNCKYWSKIELIPFMLRKLNVITAHEAYFETLKTKRAQIYSTKLEPLKVD